MDLDDIVETIKKEETQLSWQGTFSQYFDIAVHHPQVARLSSARIYDMILAAGVKPGRFGQTEYALFSGDLFGIEKTIQQVVDYYASAARRLETRKRILLLMGPPATGKTTLANILKKGLEDFTRTAAGALYAIQGCPMQEEPLHLIPPAYREEIYKNYGLYIEGELCPHCRWMLEKTYRGNIDQVKVKRIGLSEAMGIGIGTFVATDPNSEDITRLVGNVDSSAINGDRLESFGKAYRLNGELEIANRGLMEFIEMFKLDERFLTVLLVLTEEQKIKAPGYGTIYTDVSLLAHSNEAEYASLLANQKTEALQDRITVVRVPYNLRLQDEVRIYRKLLDQVDLKGIHITPLALPVASIFAILSRLQPSPKWGLSLVKKMQLYDGQFVEGFTARDIEEMHAESPREGMIGISPRFVMDQISRAASKPGLKCLDPIDLLQEMWAGVEQSPTLSREEHARLYNLFRDTRRVYDEMARREVRKAFVQDFDRSASRLIQKYVENVNAYFDRAGNHNGHDPEAEANERWMRSVEQSVGIPDSERVNFRREIQSKAAVWASAGFPIDARLDARLEEAVVRQICPGDAKIYAAIGPKQNISSEGFAKRNEVIQRLARERGYEEECAHKLVDYVANGMMPARRTSRASLPKALRWLNG